MDYYLLTLSIIPLFVSRAALPIFTTACFARWGSTWDVGWLGFFEDFTGLDLLDNIPVWATGDEVLIVLGIFAAIEFFMRHAPETRMLMDGASDCIIKAMAAGSCSYLLVGGDLDGLLNLWVESGDLTHFQWGMGLQYTWSFGIGFAVFILASTRSVIWEFLEEIDPDGELGITPLFAWLEDTVGFLGILFAFIMPGLTAIAAFVGIIGAWSVAKGIEAMERASHEPCVRCKTLGPKCGPNCASCGVKRATVNKVGLLGRVLDEPAPSEAQHRIALIATHRCPTCGHRLGRSGASPTCEACSEPVFASTSDRAAYVSDLSSRLPSTLLVCGMCSFIPVLGLIPGYFYYQLTLLAGLRSYMPTSSRFGRRWLMRLFKLSLLAFQWVPFIGVITLPIICFVDYRIARKAVLNAA